jgi:hypothetical protein
MATGKRRVEQKMQIFRSLELAQRLRQNNVLMKIDALIDWGALRLGLWIYTSASYRMVGDRNHLTRY